MDKYSVNCKNCEEESSATLVSDDFWKCDNCGYFTDAESGRITNETEKAYYQEPRDI